MISPGIDALGSIPAPHRVRIAIAAMLLWGVALASVAAESEHIALPEPRTDGEMSVEAALAQRRSIRAFAGQAIGIADLGQLLWAAQGITSRRGYRTAPSAGALYPLEVYVVAGDVDGVAPGIYKYEPRNHTLSHWRDGDHRKALASAAWMQTPVLEAPAVIAFTAVESRTSWKYGGRAKRYVQIEVGHAAQNVFLQVQALDLGAVVIGAFRDGAVDRVLKLPHGEESLYLMPIGVPRSGARR